jgi:hypothetical protein
VRILRWATTAARAARVAVGKTAKTESPDVETVVPPLSATAARRIAWCRFSTAAKASPSSMTSLVDPSMSVMRNVTVPVGSDIGRGRVEVPAAMRSVTHPEGSGER